MPVRNHLAGILLLLYLLGATFSALKPESNAYFWAYFTKYAYSSFYNGGRNYPWLLFAQ